MSDPCHSPVDVYACEILGHMCGSVRENPQKDDKNFQIKDRTFCKVPAVPVSDVEILLAASDFSKSWN